jgi:hypothetical protein
MGGEKHSAGLLAALLGWALRVCEAQQAEAAAAAAAAAAVAGAGAAGNFWLGMSCGVARAVEQWDSRANSARNFSAEANIDGLIGAS